MTTILLPLLAAAGLALVAAATWQHLRYTRTRRQRVDDRQPLLYAGTSFHGAIFVKLPDASGREAELGTLRAIRGAVESAGEGRVVYAGLVALNMASSTQLPNDWSGFVLAQFPSRDAFDRCHGSTPLRSALEHCERTHVHGFQRPAAMNLLIPLGLGGLRLRDLLLQKKPILPFQPVADADALPPLLRKRGEMAQLDAYRDVRSDAVVIINLIQPGTAEQRAADGAYTREMIRGMAEGGYGPTHMGRAVTVEGDTRFRSFAAVYYPGIDHMQAMLGSTFMNRIAPGKQLGDTLAIATIPVLSKLVGGQGATPAEPRILGVPMKEIPK